MSKLTGKDIYIKEVTTPFIIIRLRSDGIIISEEPEHFPQDSSPAIAKEIMRAVKEVCGEEHYPIMSRVGNRQLNKEERRYYMKQADMPITRVAMIVKTPFQRLLANFLMGINKVPYETRMFTNEDKAAQWLKE